MGQKCSVLSCRHVEQSETAEMSRVDSPDPIMYDLMRKSIQATTILWNNYEQQFCPKDEAVNYVETNETTVASSSSSLTNKGFVPSRSISSPTTTASSSIVIGQSHLLFKNNINNSNKNQHSHTTMVPHSNNTGTILIYNNNHNSSTTTPATVSGTVISTATSSVESRYGNNNTSKMSQYNDNNSANTMNNETTIQSDDDLLDGGKSKQATTTENNMITSSSPSPSSSCSYCTYCHNKIIQNEQEYIQEMIVKKCPTRLLIRRRSLSLRGGVMIEEGGSGTHIYAIRYPQDDNTIQLRSYDDDEQSFNLSSTIQQEQYPTSSSRKVVNYSDVGENIIMSNSFNATTDPGPTTNNDNDDNVSNMYRNANENACSICTCKKQKEDTINIIQNQQDIVPTTVTPATTNQLTGQSSIVKNKNKKDFQKKSTVPALQQTSTSPTCSSIIATATTAVASNTSNNTNNNKTSKPENVNEIFSITAMDSAPKRHVLEWVTVSEEHNIYVADVGLTTAQCDELVATTEQTCKGQYAAYTYAKQTLGCREYPVLAQTSFAPVHTIVHAITSKFPVATGTIQDADEHNNDTAVDASTAKSDDTTDGKSATMKNNNDVNQGINTVALQSSINSTETNEQGFEKQHRLQLDDREPHIVKYDVTRKERQKLDMHTDKSEWTFLIALSNGCGVDYEGGGTYFECLDATVHIQRGHALVFPGKLRHCGQKITSGLRFLLVGFLVDKETTPSKNGSTIAKQSSVSHNNKALLPTLENQKKRNSNSNQATSGVKNFSGSADLVTSLSSSSC